jgi:hypothetical protein
MSGKFWLHFCISFILNLVFFLMILTDRSFLPMAVGDWLDLFWFIATPIYGVWRVLSGETRKPYLLGLLAALVAFYILKSILHLPGNWFFLG